MRILLIEDDKDLCQAISFALSKEGYEVDVCNEGDDGLRIIRECAHDFILLDRMLPRLNGIDILRIARREGIQTPILMVTALGASDNLVEGLDSGADDYIVKPFIMDELLARIRAMGRRPQTWEIGGEITHDAMVLEPAKMILRSGDKKTSLTKKECALMEMFMRNIGAVLPRSTLLTHVWGKDMTVEEGILDNYMTFLRRRLKSVSGSLVINTVRGVGYVMEDAPNEKQ